MMDDGRRGGRGRHGRPRDPPAKAAGQGDRRMSLSVALVATLALAASAESPQDAAGWRAQADALFAQGNFRGSLQAAERARALDPADPWAGYAWVRALAAVDAES